MLYIRRYDRLTAPVTAPTFDLFPETIVGALCHLPQLKQINTPFGFLPTTSTHEAATTFAGVVIKHVAAKPLEHNGYSYLEGENIIITTDADFRMSTNITKETLRM